MKLLVLGGTAFVGRAIVEAALAVDCDVTVFGRGRTGVELFPSVPRLLGDRRDGDYTALTGTRWDAVIDVSAYVPRHVSQAAAVLAARTDRYVLISTGSVYDRNRVRAPVAPDAPRWPAERATEEVTGDTYGPLKVACEDDAHELYGERAAIVRPCIVAGPHDPTDRFTWWARRASRGGRIELPGRTDQPVVVVDSRDVASLVLALATRGLGGVYNAAGPPTTLSGLVATCAEVAGTSVELVSTPGGPQLPLQEDESWDVMADRDATGARAVGMTSTPLAKTAADVLAWDRSRGQPPLTVDP